MYEVLFWIDLNDVVLDILRILGPLRFTSVDLMSCLVSLVNWALNKITHKMRMDGYNGSNRQQ